MGLAKATDAGGGDAGNTDDPCRQSTDDPKQEGDSDAQTSS